MSAATVVKSGWLTKRGGIRKNWKKRWFIVYENNEAIYYENENARKELGKIDLTQAVAVGPSVEKEVPEYALDIVTPERTWVVAADKQESMDRWIGCLNEIVGSHSNAFESTKEGFLTKKGNVVKSWRKRYFALGAGCLFYFHDTEECHKFKRIAGHSQEMFQNAFQFVRGSVPLENAEIRKEGNFDEKSNVFSIQTSRRTYYMYADNVSETEKWIDEIEKEIQAWVTHRTEGMLSNEYSSDDEEEFDDEEESERKTVDYGPRLSRSEEDVLRKWMREVSKGVKLLVHSEEGSSEQIVEIDKETGLLQWEKGEILLDSVIGVVKGKEHEFFKTKDKNDVDGSLTFSVISKYEQLHVETSDEVERDKWASCLKVVCEREKCKKL